MISTVLSDRNIAAMQFSHKTTMKLIVLPENLSVRQSHALRRTIPRVTVCIATHLGVCSRQAISGSHAAARAAYSY